MARLECSKATLHLDLWDEGKKMHVCNGITVVAGSVAYANVVIDAYGRLIRISLSFPSDHFDQVIEGASEKYGKPTQSSAVAVQNRAGATFQNSILTWGNPKGDYIQGIYRFPLERYLDRLLPSFPQKIAAGGI